MGRSRDITVENSRLRAVISVDGGLFFREFVNKSGRTALKEERTDGGKKQKRCGLFELTVRGKTLCTEDFKLVSVDRAEDQTQELVTVLAEHEEEKLKIRLHLLNDRKASVTLLYQIWDGYRNGVPREISIHLPFLAELSSGEEDERIYYPACTWKGRSGDVLKRPPESFYSSDMKMPLVLCGKKGLGSGFCLRFLSQSDLSDEGSVQNVSLQLLETLRDWDSLLNNRVAIHPDASFNDTLEIQVTGVEHGWPEAFSICRREWQAGYDLSEYEKKELQWIENCVVNHFAFLYGREAFDFEVQKVDVEGILKEGEAFGGFDTVTVWNQYPRLGVDWRNQWEFYDDFPGGRDALKEMTDRFHEKGVKVLLPYIPWDRGEEESTAFMGNEFARIIKDTGADGFQLDTCKELPLSFRKKLDKIRPGLLLQTQAHPYKNEPIEFITSSWDEFWHGDPMPEVDLFRFMLPQHIAPVISRWLREEDKESLIKRCIFNAAPIVIWQDVFGRWMPFTEGQKEKIREWKRAYLDNKEIYRGKEPIPLYPVEGKHVYCNRFADDEEKQRIYALYNDGEEAREAWIEDCAYGGGTKEGDKREGREKTGGEDRGRGGWKQMLGEGEILRIETVESGEGDDARYTERICVRLPAKGILHVKRTPGGRA